MDYIFQNLYSRPFWMPSRHIETIIPALVRKVKGVNFTRERLELPDGDFLDLDWLPAGNENLVIICHGLEGSSDRAYIKGMAKILHSAGFSILAWNYRGCSGELNRLPRFYHSGETGDLKAVFNFALDKGFKSIRLVGFSLGGNLILKFLGEEKEKLKELVPAAIAISVPLHLHSCSLQIGKASNYLYTKRFLETLNEKVRQKAKVFPQVFDLEQLKKVKNLLDFDNYFTAPLHGFKDAIDYYTKCSALFFLEDIAVPSLIVNAKNDPFLSPMAFPADIKNANVYFITPEKGGHVGFSAPKLNGTSWVEHLALHWLKTSDL